MKKIRLTENELTNIVKKIIKEMNEDPYYELKKVIIDSIDFDGYDDVDDRDKLRAGMEVFQSEYGWAVSRMGIKKAFKEYLLGLPSWLDIPYYYTDMKNMLYSLGFDEVQDMDDDEISEMYYDMITDIFIKHK
jgi:hypothetical protein